MKWPASLATSSGIIPAHSITRSKRSERRPAMEHIAIDLGGRESQVCVRAPDGSILEERRVATTALPAYLATRPPSRVILETCSESFRVAAAGQAAGHDVRVVPAARVRAACPTGLPPALARQLDTIEQLTAQVAAADRELAQLVRGDGVCRRLRSVPGVGPVTATRFTATIDNPGRFGAAHAVGAYLGLV